MVEEGAQGKESADRGDASMHMQIWKRTAKWLAGYGQELSLAGFDDVMFGNGVGGSDRAGSVW